MADGVEAGGDAGGLELEVEEAGGAVHVGENGEEDDEHHEGPWQGRAPAKTREERWRRVECEGDGRSARDESGAGLTGLLTEDLLGVGEEPDYGKEGEGERSIKQSADRAESVIACHVLDHRKGGMQGARAEEDKGEGDL